MAEHDPERREIRLAVVMTGGVSLAVWIGGVVAEIYRAVSHDGIYGALADMTRSEVSVDVISGASAGGVNGAFLAAAVAYQPPCSSLDHLREVWRKAGAFSSLLRETKERNPASLLQGDAYFYTELHENLGQWIADGVRQSDPDLEPGDIRLVMTATTLFPDRREYYDDLGVRIVEPVHRARFTFTSNDFVDTDRDLLARRLALAARATASFPGAFEPAYVPIGETIAIGPGGVELPDMQGIASFPRSRWVIDGGVLVNKPVEPALEGIRERGADREIRRVLLYINPDPSEVSPEEVRQGDAPSPIPSVAKVVGKAIIGLPRTESISADLLTIYTQNHKLRQQRETRTALLLGVRTHDSGAGTDASALGPWRLERIDLSGLARGMFAIWLRQRSFESVARRLDLRPQHADEQGRVGESNYTWATLADALRAARGRQGWLASEFPVLSSEQPPTHPGDDTPPVQLDAVDQWRFGLEPLEYLCSVVLDFVRRSFSLLPVTSADDRTKAGIPVKDLRVQLGEVRAAVHQQRELIGVLRMVDDDFWRTELGRADWPAGTANARADAIFATWPVPSVELPADSSTLPEQDRLRSWTRALSMFHWANDAWAEARGMRASAADQPNPDARWAEMSTKLTDPALNLLVALPSVAAIAGAGGSTADLASRPTDPPTPTGRAYRRAEMLIARRLGALLVDNAELYYRVVDQVLETSWRTDAASPRGEHPSRPTFVEQLATSDPDGIERNHLRTEAAILAASVMRVTSVVPSVVASPTASPTRAPDGRWAQALREVLALYIVHSMTEHGVEDREVRIDFVQVSADNDSPIAPGRDAASKVAGLQLGHFGGFLKGSWRVNDWLWGALDGANRIVDVLVDPDRLRQGFHRAADAATALQSVARGRVPGTTEPLVPGLTPADLAHLDSLVHARVFDAMLAELRFIDDHEVAPGDLTVTRATLAFTAQLFVGRRELPELAKAIRASTAEGASESTEASLFLAQIDEALRSATRISPTDAVEIPLSAVRRLIDSCPVAKERVKQELGSDRMTATLAQAAAVTGNLVSGRQAGVGVLRRPLGTVRYGLLGLNYLAQSTLQRTRTSSGFRNLLLAVGGVIVAFLVLGVKLPPVFTIGAVVAIGAWLALTSWALRSWRGLLAVSPALVVGAFGALSVLTHAAAVDAFTTTARAVAWKRPVLIAGLTAVTIGVIVELVRFVVSNLERRDEVSGLNWAHARHALVWGVSGVVWWPLWSRLFKGRYHGARRWFVDRVGELHSLRFTLLIAVPAALVAMDLLRTWLREQTLVAQRRRAAKLVAATSGDPPPPPPPGRGGARRPKASSAIGTIGVRRSAPRPPGAASPPRWSPPTATPGVPPEQPSDPELAGR